ncbi:aspartate-semialdehyde dehydrogenase [Aliifodinibius salipaludis]|uniref:Aspartate-semialdehyde dehydrogenase n=1 Tax=Fodinibius salipaludis TaxID=2032627 RepID=A0A2A2G6U6_9BACT|nr:aspartate-semialdehyde dehydrogenase [Aliifodinibius salipaludis]PAU93018.1 aspartate-semialdehyde dehydrogenase [Aliifodinibius salipaludis]
MHSYQVGVLGATGAVGQKFIRLLENHPWFTVKVLGASKRSAGKKYKQAAHWIEKTEQPSAAANLEVKACDPAKFAGVDFVFSGLDSSVAGEIEKSFAEAGIPVISNAKNYRMHDQVPLLVPEVNPDHADIIKNQSFDANGNGWIVTNPNCVSVPLSMSLKPLSDAFGIQSLVVTSMQSVSGAGYPGVSSMDIVANVVPYIGGEEPKVQTEATKVLGSLSDNSIAFNDFDIQATAVRVPTIEGHLLSVSVKLKNAPTSIEEAEQAFTDWENPIADLNLPSSPANPVRLYKEDRYPQPRLHADREGGMQTAVGRLRKGTVMDLGYVTMAHNTIRGAAGGAILNAELLAEKGYIN